MEDKPKVLLVGFDAAPSKAFTSLCEALTRADVTPILKVAGGQSFGQVNDELLKDELSQQVVSTEVVVIGLSSSPERASMEIFAAKQAKVHGKHLVVYGDIDRAWYRAHAIGMSAEVREYVSGYLGVTDTDAQSAMTVFPNAIAFGTGNPDREIQFFDFATYNRETVRSQLHIREHEKLVLVSGRKQRDENLSMWRLTRTTLEVLSTAGKFTNTIHMVISLHPGDKTPFSAYEQFLSEDTTVKVSVLRKDFMATDVATAGCDVMVEFLSTSGVVAAMRGIPVVTLMLPELLDFLLTIDGSSEPEIVRHGASHPVTTQKELEQVLVRLLTYPIGKQSSQPFGTLPIPAYVGQTQEEMVGAILSFL